MSFANQPPASVRFIAIMIASVGLLISIPAYLVMAWIFLTMPNAAFGLLMLCWLASIIYGAILTVRSLRAGGTTWLSFNRALGGAVFAGLSSGFALFVAWSVSSLLEAW